MSGLSATCALPLLLGLTLLAPAAGASPDISSDFESGGLLKSDTPPGPWSTSWRPSAANTLTPSPEAAHRGHLGLRLVDQDTAAKAYGQNDVSYDTWYPAGDYYLRFWFRLAATNGRGNVELGVLSEATNNKGLAVLGFQYPGPLLYTSGLNADAGWPPVAAPALTVGTWHLLELALKGVGSDAGVSLLFVDGVRGSEVPGLDLSSQVGPLSHISIGEPWSPDCQFAGILDFDDVRATRAPPASHFALGLDGGLTAGTCNPLTVSLHDSDKDALAPPTEPVPVQLDVDGGRLFADATCETAVTAATLKPDVPSVTLYLRPVGEGTATLAASNVDFLGASASLPVRRGAQAHVVPSTTQVGPGGKVTLDATGSTPSGGSDRLVEWRWAQLAGPGGVPLDATATPSVQLNEPGVYVFEVSVLDSAGSLSEPARAAVTVSGASSVPSSRLSSCAVGADPTWLALLGGLVLLVRRRSTRA